MVKIVFAVILIGLAIVAMEWLGLWPEWAQMERGRMPRVPH